jgi:hypothetical protein
MGFVELNKVDYQYTSGELDKIRRGVDAAQALAEEMASAAAKVLTKPPRNDDSEVGRRELATTLSPADEQAFRAKIRKLMEEFGL